MATVTGAPIRITFTRSIPNEIRIPVCEGELPIFERSRGTGRAGERICYGHKTSSTNGQFDVDSNVSCSGPDASPTENVFWPVGSAPRGTYELYARRYSACSDSTTPAFTLRVFEGSTVVRTINGTMPEGGETEHYTHVY